MPAFEQIRKYADSRALVLVPIYNLKTLKSDAVQPITEKQLLDLNITPLDEYCRSSFFLFHQSGNWKNCRYGPGSAQKFKMAFPVFSKAYMKSVGKSRTFSVIVLKLNFIIYFIVFFYFNILVWVVKNCKCKILYS